MVGDLARPAGTAAGQPGADGRSRFGRNFATQTFVRVETGTGRTHPTGGTDRREVATVVLAIVLIVLAILLGLGGLLFTALKWLLIVAAVLLVAGIVMGVIGRGKARSIR